LLYCGSLFVCTKYLSMSKVGTDHYCLLFHCEGLHTEFLCGSLAGAWLAAQGRDDMVNAGTVKTGSGISI
jgi:hypothetical protein